METPPKLETPHQEPALIPAPNAPDSSLAIGSLVTAILGWTFVPLLGSIAAIILGHLAKKEIRESRGGIQGGAMATAGLIMGYIQVGLVVAALIVAITLLIVTRSTGTVIGGSAV